MPDDIRTIIRNAGGPTRVARLLGIPLRTAMDWSRGARKPPPWVAALVAGALKRRQR